jgi:uncharacterized protein YciI
MTEPTQMLESAHVEVERLKARMLKRSFFVMSRTIVEPAKLPTLALPHYQWIIELEKQGVVFASGPLFKRDGSAGVGMTVFRVTDYEAAEALAASDPFCTGGAATYDLQRWQINEGRLTVTVDFSDQSYKFD